jgi:hypothetical protein
MGKFKRIPVKDIRAMQKTLDDLPDKNLGKTREEAADMLGANMLKALEKGYTVRELAAIMAQGNVPIPAPVLRAKAVPPKPATPKKEPKPRADAPKATAIKATTINTESAETLQPQQYPAYYTPDIPDKEL